MKPVIGIVSRPDIESDNLSVLCIYDDYRNAILKSGGIPIGIMPPQPISYYNTPRNEIKPLTDFEKEIIKRQIKLCDGIILQGGFKWFYYDEYVLDCALDLNIPILGICLGMQLINNFIVNQSGKFNKTIKIESDINHKQKGVKKAHKIYIKKDSLLYKILKKENIYVNSFHNYTVIKNDIIDVAFAPDRVVEAIELKDKKFVLGLQWHPEKTYDSSINSKKIFDYFIKTCKNNKNSK